MGLLRLFLAMVVATDHFRAYVLKQNGLGLDGSYELGMNAGHAVMCFYVVSGFLISYALANKYTSAGSVKDFYRSRIIRIYPLYLIHTTIIATAYHSSDKIGTRLLNVITSHFNAERSSHDSQLPFDLYFCKHGPCQTL